MPDRGIPPEELAALAIGAHAPADRERLLRAIDDDDAALRELDELEALDGLLRAMAPAAEPPPELRARTVAAVTAAAGAGAVSQSPPRSRLRDRLRLRWVAGVTAAAAAAIAIVVAVAPDERGELELQAELRSPTAAGVTATADVRLLGIGREIHFTTTQLPILPKGEFYELWFVGPGDRPERPNRISAGTFHPDPEGVSDVRFTAAVDPRLYPVLAVTAEPGDGDPRPSRREVLRSST